MPGGLPRHRLGRWRRRSRELQQRAGGNSSGRGAPGSQHAGRVATVESAERYLVDTVVAVQSEVALDCLGLWRSAPQAGITPSTPSKQAGVGGEATEAGAEGAEVDELGVAVPSRRAGKGRDVTADRLAAVVT
jgi:hypothetical protein